MIFTTLGERLRRARELSNISAVEAAGLIGCKKGMVYKIERNSSDRTLKELIQLASINDTSFTELIDAEPIKLSHPSILVIDSNTEFTNVYKSAFNKAFNQVNAKYVVNIGKAHEYIRGGKFNLIIIRHGNRNSLDELMSYLQESQNKYCPVLVVAKINIDKTIEAANKHNAYWFDLNRGSDKLISIIDDVLRVG
jgi:transcriptional regulator with XRE-family HTH domain